MTFRAALVGAAVLLALAAPAAAQSPEPGAPEPRTNLSDVEDEVICLVCGTTLELTDDAPQAEQLRDQIRGLIDQGLTKDEVKDALVADYGESVLSTPDTEGFDLTAWVLPGLGIVLAGAGIAFGLARNRSRRDTAAASPALSDEDRERLDADIASFDR